jgi:hypothetical protein
MDVQSLSWLKAKAYIYTMLLLVVYCERVLQSIDASAFHSSSGILKLALIFRSPYSRTLLSKEIQFSAQEKDKNSMFSSKSTSSISMR